jgi:molybdate transport system regulatory protein
MAVSARNQLVGKVSATAHGAVNDEVELILDGARNLSLSSHPAVKKRWV